MSTAVAASASQVATSTAAAAALDVTGLTKANIPTPALVVDLPALDANIQKMADHCKQAKVGFRPHAKTHKCPDIAKRQIAAGASGICCATVPEAEALAAAGIPGLLLTSPIVDPGKIGRVVAIASRGGQIMLAVGSVRQAELLSTAADAAKVDLEVLVDLDVGDRRTGSLPESAIELATRIVPLPRLKLRGVQAYAGHASHTVGFEERKKVSQTAIWKAAAVKLTLQKLFGVKDLMLSGGSTGTYNIDSAIDGMTELQVGSYVFMDLDYRRIGGQGGAEKYADFQHSLTVLATVINATHPDRVTVDAGTKALDTTTAWVPEVKDLKGLVYAKNGDEFGALSLAPGGKLPALGDRVEFIVPHCDPNVNLYDRIYACRGDKVEAIWPITARRETA